MKSGGNKRISRFSFRGETKRGELEVGDTKKKKEKKERQSGEEGKKDLSNKFKEFPDIYLHIMRCCSFGFLSRIRTWPSFFLSIFCSLLDEFLTRRTVGRFSFFESFSSLLFFVPLIIILEGEHTTYNKHNIIHKYLILLCML